MSEIPELPKITLDVLGDVKRPDGGKYLRLRHAEVTLAYPSGEQSPPFIYDLIVRDALDAVVVVAHFGTEKGRVVYLRSAVRPPVKLRNVAPAYDGSMWEVVAGLIEPDEDAAVAAARELEEELGAKVDASAMISLGGATFPAPGVIGERHVYFHVEVDPTKLTRPAEDGSALEREARIVPVLLDEALAWIRRGDLYDAKTEIALRRLKEVS
ncbi:MAG: NUDIX hydrolase [Polyangiaceae bacterium]